MVEGLYVVFVILEMIVLLYIASRISPPVQILSFYPFVGFIFGIVSNLYLELIQPYVVEQGVVAGMTGATARLIPVLVIVVCGLLIGSRLCISFKGLGVKFKSKMFLDGAKILACLLLSASYLNVLLTGDLPVLSDGYINRFDYLENTKFWFVLQYFGEVVAFVPLVCGYWFFYAIQLQENAVMRPVGLLLLYFIYMVLIGHKFGVFLFSLCLFAIPYLVYNARSVWSLKYFKRYLKYGLPIFVGGLAIVYYHYSKYSLVDDFGGAGAFLAYRIFGLQGHVWWGIDQLIWDGGAISFDFVGALDGMANMMHLLNPGMVDSAIERGVNFTFGFPASPLLFFGYGLGLVVVFFIALGTGVFFRMLAVYIHAGEVVPCVVGGYIYVWLVSFLSLGSFSLFFSGKFIFMMLIFAIVVVLVGVPARKNVVRGARR